MTETKQVNTRPATAQQLTAALTYYRRHYGPATISDISAAAHTRRNWHTLAELRALQHAGIQRRA
jgi:hypothetical protein